PMAVVADGAGALYVADTNNSCIRKINLATGEVSTLAGAMNQPGSVDGVGTAARLFYPCGLAYDAARNALYVADTTNETIRRVDLGNGAVTTLAGKSLTIGNQDGPGTSARFHYPRGVAFDGANTLFIADDYNEKVRALDLTTNVVSTLAGTGF